MMMGMAKRGLGLLEAHMRSLDPATPTARERLADALGEPFASTLVKAVRGPGLRPRRDTLRPPGEVSERSKERDWKSRTC
jgi:hypothetical protein